MKETSEKQNIGICKFCGQKKKLIKAHIIPKNFYLSRKKDRYLCINSKTGEYTFQQNGGYDSNILCSNCDNHILGDFDKEGYQILLGNFNKYKYIQLHPQCKIYQLDSNDFDYTKLRNFFISILWRASVSKLEEWSNINLGGYEKKAYEILKGKKEHSELFKILIYKNCYTEDINQEVLIAKGKTSKYKKYVIQMAGYRIEIMVDSARITNKYRLQYETYFLNSTYAHIIETTEVSRRVNHEYNLRMRELYEKGFVPPKPSGIK